MNHQRTERRYWRRSYMRHLAEWIGPEAPEVIGAEMPDWSDNWLTLVSRIAQATAGTVDVAAARDHMAEALLYAQAVHAEPQPAEPLREPCTRYTSVYEAIHAPAEHSDEIGDVEFCYGDPAELARIAEQDEQAANLGQQLPDESHEHEHQDHAIEALAAVDQRPAQVAPGHPVVRRHLTRGLSRLSVRGTRTVRHRPCAPACPADRSRTAPKRGTFPVGRPIGERPPYGSIRGHDHAPGLRVAVSGRVHHGASRNGFTHPRARTRKQK